MRPRLFLAAVTGVLLAATRCFANGGMAELASIQTDLNRIASGRPPQAATSEPLEHVVTALANGWVGPGADPAMADAALHKVEAEIGRRSEKLASEYRAHSLNSSDLAYYLAKLDAVRRAGADPLARLVLALHSIDAILIAENVKPWSLDYETRDYVQFPSLDGQAVGAWLRLPCRMLPGYEAEFRAAIAALGELANPVFDCPGPAQGPPNLDALAAFARDPTATAPSIARYASSRPARPLPHPTRPLRPPKGAWSHETAVAFMASDPRRAEARLKLATTPGQKLDYALFLFAFHRPSPRRDGQIRGLLAAIGDSTPETLGTQTAQEPLRFDGSTKSMTIAVADQRIYDPASGDGTTGSGDGGLELNPEAPNAFGKTPLMAAAQVDQIRSVRLLLLHHADPNARTDATSTAWAQRTPLMYAAANASLWTIKALLNAGADPQMADSKGAKALHYLLGYGPLPANPRLSPKDLAKAIRLLY